MGARFPGVTKGHQIKERERKERKEKKTGKKGKKDEKQRGQKGKDRQINMMRRAEKGAIQVRYAPLPIVCRDGALGKKNAPNRTNWLQFFFLHF